ncbi:MAG: ankyrin repeat domain-containing protein [Bacteroidetes bacterium]|nr:ankyrin repeat domain-containing protein [Bacteroidota bacterium]
MLSRSLKPILITISILLSSLVFSQEIFTAIMQGNLDKTKQLIEADPANATIKNPRGFSPIHFAANFKQLEIAKLLVENGADPFIVGPNKRQAIHWAAANGSAEILRWLSSLGADLNLKDETNKTPLYMAATRGHTESVNFLLTQNVEIQTEGDGAFELLYFSTMFGFEGIFEKFLNSGFDLKQLTKDGSGLMLAAALKGNIDFISKLSDRGLDLNLLNDFGECALHISIIHKNYEAMKKLIELGADIHLKNFAGQNALSFAQKLESTSFTDHLKLKGAIQHDDLILKDKYPGFDTPGLTPKLFAPGLISTSDFEERDVMFSPDFKEFYFTRYSRITQMPMTVQLMNFENGQWSKPVAAAFSGKFNAAECFISHDNKNLYFISQRSQDGTDIPSPWEIWIADRINGDWDNFRLFDTTQLKGCFYPSLTKNGELLYTGVGNDLYLSKIENGKVVDPIKLGPEINTADGEYNAMISPNGDYIIFTSHGFEDHFGGGDLYISFRKDDNSWTPSINMGPEINTAATEYCPNVSPDEKYFFFTSNKKGTEDIYWVDAEIINQLKKEAFRK